MMDQPETIEYREAWIKAERAATIAEFLSVDLLGWQSEQIAPPLSDDTIIPSGESPPSETTRRVSGEERIPKTLF